MLNYKHPYIKNVEPIWCGRDYNLIIVCSTAYENYDFYASLQTPDGTIINFTIEKTVNIINPSVLVELKLNETQTATLEPNTIVKYDVGHKYNSLRYNLLAGEIKVANTITVIS